MTAITEERGEDIDAMAQQMMSMGFKRQDAKAALVRESGNIVAAIKSLAQLDPTFLDDC